METRFYVKLRPGAGGHAAGDRRFGHCHRPAAELAVTAGAGCRCASTHAALRAARRPWVSGACSVATNAQVLHFKQSGRPSLAIDPLAIAAGEDVAAQALAFAELLLASGPVLFYATAEPSAVRAVQENGRGPRGRDGGTHARIAAGLVQRGVRQLLVAGGETSGAVVQALGVQRMAIGPQIDPGVP